MPSNPTGKPLILYSRVNRLQKPSVVEPVDPFERCKLHRLDVSPRTPPADHLVHAEVLVPNPLNIYPQSRISLQPRRNAFRIALTRLLLVMAPRSDLQFGADRLDSVLGTMGADSMAARSTPRWPGQVTRMFGQHFLIQFRAPDLLGSRGILRSRCMPLQLGESRRHPVKLPIVTQLRKIHLVSQLDGDRPNVYQQT
jgi:hypothetical protein